MPIPPLAIAFKYDNSLRQGIPLHAPETLGEDGAGVRSEKQDLLSACRDFEAIFLAQLMAQMRRTVPKGGILPHGTAESIFQAQLDAQICRNISRKGSLGLAELLYRSLSQQSLHSSVCSKVHVTPLLPTDVCGGASPS